MESDKMIGNILLHDCNCLFLVTHKFSLMFLEIISNIFWSYYNATTRLKYLLSHYNCHHHFASCPLCCLLYPSSVNDQSLLNFQTFKNNEHAWDKIPCLSSLWEKVNCESKIHMCCHHLQLHQFELHYYSSCIYYNESSIQNFPA